MRASEFRSPQLVIVSRLLVVAVVGLIFVGAMVTSKGAGMAVPDWPLSFGSVNPPGWWKDEGVFWEHGHRLFASLIGLVVITLLIFLYRIPNAKPLRPLGWLALVGVILQGVLGGVRVLLGTAGHDTEALLIAVGHACLAQSFFCLTLIFLLLIHGVEIEDKETNLLQSQYRFGIIIIIAVFIQLVLGAVIRHFAAGLAIPDFPLSFGKWLPPFDNVKVVLAFAHRAWAFVILALVFMLVTRILLDNHSGRTTRLLAWLIGAVVLLQITLGALVIWMKKFPIPTSLHVVNGALLLGLLVVFTMRAWWARRLATGASPALTGQEATI